MQKEEFTELLQRAGINKKEFAQIADVPHPTVLNWGVNRKGKVLEIPNWVRQFLYYYERAKQLEFVTDEICSKLQIVKREVD